MWSALDASFGIRSVCVVLLHVATLCVGAFSIVINFALCAHYVSLDNNGASFSPLKSPSSHQKSRRCRFRKVCDSTHALFFRAFLERDHEALLLVPCGASLTNTMRVVCTCADAARAPAVLLTPLTRAHPLSLTPSPIRHALPLSAVGSRLSSLRSSHGHTHHDTTRFEQ